MRDGRGVVHRQAKGHVAAAVVSCHGEPVMPQDTHQREAVTGHRALGVRRVISGRRRLRRLAVPPQIRADDGMCTGQRRRDAMPCRVSARMPVQQQHRRAGTPVADPQHGFPDVNLIEREATEPVHRHRNIIASFSGQREH
jgi:hypothetical protein